MKCVICNKPIEGYSNKKTCGPNCRKKLHIRNQMLKMNDFICEQTFKL